MNISKVEQDPSAPPIEDESSEEFNNDCWG